MIFDANNWSRKGNGKLFEFSISDEGLVEVLASVLPKNWEPYSVVGTYMAKTESGYKSTFENVQVKDVLRLSGKGIWQFFIKSEVLSGRIDPANDLHLDRILSINGLINLQHGRVVRGDKMKSSIGIVDSIVGKKTGKIIVHDQYLEIFDCLKKGIQSLSKLDDGNHLSSDL